jgi:hypothetical protein
MNKVVIAFEAAERPGNRTESYGGSAGALPAAEDIQ